MEIRIPYGKETIGAQLPQENLMGVYHPAKYTGNRDEGDLIDTALDCPLMGPDLKTLAAGKQHIVIITSDHTRPLPSRLTMPRILKRLREGNPQAQITILVATGCHRAMTEEEKNARFGPEIARNERFVMHNAFDEEQMVALGNLPSGGELKVNRVAAQADLLIAEGFIEPHFFAGFSGGRKAVLPGIASAQSVRYNHNAAFIDSPLARAGVLEGNPIHRDMLWAAKACKLQFILNVVLDADKKVIHAVAGEPERAHFSGCTFAARHAMLPKFRADIVISSNGGYPLDQNAYQAVKGMTTAAQCCKDGGVVILAAQCSDGHGGQAFYEALRDAKSPEELLSRIREVPAERTPPDQWQYQILCKILTRCQVILVSDLPREMVEDMKLTWQPNLQAAVDYALQKMGPQAQVAVVPDGVSAIAL